MAAGALLAAAVVIFAWNDSRGGTEDRGWLTYRDAKYGFSISYPSDWIIERGHVSILPGPDQELHGIAFAVPPTMTTGTNLRSDSFISVSVVTANVRTEQGRCGSDLFLLEAKHTPITDAGRRYVYAEQTDAGAGNIYEQHAYALTGSDPCVGVLYFIHSTNIGNYDPGTVREFDRAKLMAAFDRIRRSLVLSPRAHH